MKFIADFHIHSKYSRATARSLDFEHLYISAQIKGITVVGTGDFTHPAWWQEIGEKLVPAEAGLFKLKPDIARACDQAVPPACRRPVRFLLVTEISNIYKKDQRTRKNHNLVFMPDKTSAEKFNRRLDAIGNIRSDGRPILGLDARNLLEIVLETDTRAFLVPAHIWTPWFSLLGSKSGFDSVEACFDDLTPHIFALETGLSSDPPMNWRVSHLDAYTLISNSDAHSPSKLGREANCFNTELSYGAMRSAMETADADQFQGTIEFYPEEGKYHVDGHRKCQFRSNPRQTRQLDGLCPVCGKPLTLGVLYRVEALADREEGAQPAKSSPFRNLIPLEDILAEVLQVGPKTKKVQQAYDRLIRMYGSEFDILGDIPAEDLSASNIPLLTNAIGRMREGRIIFDPGYDGEYGRVRIFDSSERSVLQGQQRLFDLPDASSAPAQSPPQYQEKNPPPPQMLAAREGDNIVGDAIEAFPSAGLQLNTEQQMAVEHTDGPLLICAGPGTGKTRTITCRMAALIDQGGIAAENILAVTFTNKAADEMRHRLQAMLPADSGLPMVATFHGFCWRLLRDYYDGEAGAIVDETGRRAILSDAVDLCQSEGLTIDLSVDALLAMVVQAKQQLLGPGEDLRRIADGAHLSPFGQIYTRYQQLMVLQDRVDFEDLIFQVIKLLETDKSWRSRVRERYSHIFVDEFQDINDAQYRLLRALGPSKSQVCVIGDPNQAIYGFRGSDVRFFKQFIEHYGGTRVIQLQRNYRSTETILSASFQVIQDHQVNLQTGDHARIYSNIPGIARLSVMEAPSARAEAVAIGQTIEQMVGGTGFHSIDFEKVVQDDSEKERSFADFAVLCRTGDQVQLIADQLASAGIPCQMVSRRMLRQPALVKVLAAFRIIIAQGAYADLNHCTDLAAAGISKETLRIFKHWAYARQLPLATALHSAGRLPIPNMSTTRQQRLVALVHLLERLQKRCTDLSTAEVLNHIVAQTTLSSKVEEEDLQWLTAQAHGLDPNAFATAMALGHDTDFYRPDVEKVAVLSLHAAKGLEFPVVFVAGCEDNLLPYRRPGKEDTDMEEERRLFYVGITRARQQLFLTWASKRTLYGKTRAQRLSPFVIAIEADLRNHIAALGKSQPPRPEQLSLF